MDDDATIDFDSLPLTRILAIRENGAWSITMCTSWQTVRVRHDGAFDDALIEAAQRIYDGENDESGSMTVH